MKLKSFDQCLDYQCLHHHQSLSLTWSLALLTVVAHLSLTSLLHKEVTLVLGLPGPPAAVVVDADEGNVSSRDPSLEAPSPVAWPCSRLHKRDQASGPPLMQWGHLLGWEASLNAEDKQREKILDLPSFKSSVVIDVFN